MKKQHRWIVAACLASAILLSADGSLKLKKIIIGKWETVAIRVELTTLKDAMQPSVVEANAENWEEKMKMKPPRSEYRRDGSFTSAYIDLQGKVFKEVGGKYIVDGNEMVLRSTTKGYDSLLYRCRVLSADAFEYTTFVDFDNDGERDDKLTGSARRLK